MVRFLKCFFEEFSSTNINTFTATEHLLTLLHIPSTVCIALFSLSTADAIPYLKSHCWHLLLLSSLFLTVCNFRDLAITSRNFLYPRKSAGHTYRSLAGQMQLMAALAFTMGSLSLLNASIIALLQLGPNQPQASYRQFAASFALFLVASAANTSFPHPQFAEHDSSRALLTFLHVVACALFCLQGLLALPEFTPAVVTDSKYALSSNLSVLASFLLVVSALFNYFHTLGLLYALRQYAEDEYGHRSNYEKVRKRKMAEGPNFVGRILGTFGSRNVAKNMNYDSEADEDLYEVESLLTSENSLHMSDSNEDLETDIEEGERRSDDDMAGEVGRREKKRKGRRQ